MDQSLKSFVSRYVIPFYYDYENNGFDTIRSFFVENPEYDKDLRLPGDGSWIESGFWENYKSGKGGKDVKKAEMDIYSYLPAIFKNSNNPDLENASNLGTSLVYNSNGKITDVSYTKSGKEDVPADLNFEIRDMGILLFKNGVGFFWYEIGFRSRISTSLYVDFLHDFKELARTGSKKFGKKIGRDEATQKPILEPFITGIWVSRILFSKRLGISFWADREVPMDDKKMLVPDKALLFQYAFVDSLSDEERNNFIFQITNGYDAKYNAPKDLEDNLYMPFGNSCFYTSNSGMSCVVTNDASNETFFTGQFKEKFIRDYFFIYLLLVYQSFSCAHYSRLLTLLPAKEQAFREDTRNVERVEVLCSSINLFLVKSIFDSVSNVDHQNGVYRYGKARLGINEDISSITAGLEGFGAIERARKNLEEKLVKEKEETEKEVKDAKLNRAVTVFGFMVVISAILDGLNLVEWFRANTLDYIHLIVMAGIILITLYLIVEILLQRNKKVNKKRKEK